MSESTFIRHIKCEKCGIEDGKGDNASLYSDGHIYCHACNFNSNSSSYAGLVLGECKELRSRKLTRETCEFMDYKVGAYTGKFKDRVLTNELVHIANYYDTNNKIIAQKLRTKLKEFKFTGDGKKVGLYGQWKWSPNKNLFCIVVEGEIDQLTVLQLQGRSYPVVSIPRGAADAKRAIENSLDWLLGWKHVVFGFDNDEAGKKAVIECQSLFEPGTFKVITWSDKDANATYTSKGKEQVTKDIWNAQEIRPRYSVTVKDIKLEKPEFGEALPWKGLSDVMYGGFRGGEIISIIGPAGCGKTTLVNQIVESRINKSGAGVCSFEHTPKETLLRYVGAKLGIKIHKPGEKWDQKLIEDTAKQYDDKLWLYDRNGRVDQDDVLYTIRYWVKAKGVKLFVIDNLKQLGVTLKKELLVTFLNKLKSLVRELQIDIILVGHVNKDTISKTSHIGFSSQVNPSKSHDWDEDKVKEIMAKLSPTWATGRIPSCENLEGGNDIEAISDHVWLCFRDKDNPDISLSRVLGIKVGKCGRIDSDYEGKIIKLYYEDNGTLVSLDKTIGEF